MTSAPAPVRGTPQGAEAGAVRSGLSFEDVTVAYHGTTVLDGFTLDVAPGEVVALLGPSGSGKTTALRTAAGFTSPVRGRVHIGGRDVTDLPPYRRGIGMVVQQYALFPHLRVEQNVAFGLKAHKVPRADIPGRVARALEMTGMAGYARRYPRELSGGQQQRVAIARALAIRPDVLLLDEPLSALDVQLRTGMLAELARLHRDLPDVSMLYVTHDQVEALTLADRIAVMKDARLVDCGTPQQLYRRPRDTFTASFVGQANLLPVTTLAETGPDGARVALADNEVRVAAVQPLPAGTDAVLCVRPHLVRLADGGDGPTLRATVTDVQWRGSVHRLHADLVTGGTVTADIGELRTPPVPGDQVVLTFDPEDAVVLPAAPDGGGKSDD
ncbi:ABC transporter ATP-binding protein [Streptomyces nodosus]|uniref:ABC-type quaternary amine transporter n=1 Tax=Streptomyces nodosus TaxID=40318 RepID=A0A0B5D7C5_9ACTN|nr:ABC transporter ATP-binding protein [Streptomyces nodosus]AJE39148.1 phosphonate ABC transporter ATP-binding protein [Streptomyces nodosus]MBB4790030.1 2-aminoethylphosphonate transport system ATP-binding protein [Streptomyces nodosus]QEV37749.1 ABC transporter ATP-binding protein [Streptomyces nodosus]